jgi:hypothetical protein
MNAELIISSALMVISAIADALIRFVVMEPDFYDN